MNCSGSQRERAEEQAGQECPGSLRTGVSGILAPGASSLPYTDTKPAGAAGFYTAINATFRFIEKRFGREGLIQYWRDLGTGYFKPVSEQWRAGGLKAVADYWRAFFAAEPGAEVEACEDDSEVRLEIKTCPLIRHLREAKREIAPCLCRHCYFVSEAMAAPAGLSVRVSGGNGTCVQRFMKRSIGEPEQRIEDIEEAS